MFIAYTIHFESGDQLDAFSPRPKPCFGSTTFVILLVSTSSQYTHCELSVKRIFFESRDQIGLK